MSDYQTYFLESGGINLGYDENSMPKRKDIEVVLKYSVPIWEYRGLTKEEYYSKQFFETGSGELLRERRQGVFLGNKVEWS